MKRRAFLLSLPLLAFARKLLRPKPVLRWRSDYGALPFICKPEHELLEPRYFVFISQKHDPLRFSVDA